MSVLAIAVFTILGGFAVLTVLTIWRLRGWGRTRHVGENAPTIPQPHAWTVADRRRIREAWGDGAGVDLGHDYKWQASE